MKISTLPLFAFVTVAAYAGGLEKTEADSVDDSGTTHGFKIEETNERIALRGAVLEACIKKKGYVSGVEEGTFLDKKTGARDLGFGLDIQDWIMEPGSDEEYRDKLP